MRLYYDIGRDDPLMQDLCQLACDNSNLDICYVREWSSQLFKLPNYLIYLIFGIKQLNCFFSTQC